MKIGVLLTIYNCENYVDDCLNPWINLKEKYDITIGCVSGMFKPYLDLGFKSKNQGTLKKLSEHNIDYLISTGEKILLGENESRDSILNILKKDNDIIWILDGDEFYTEKDIINIINYIESTPLTDWYSINFKNYTFTEQLYFNGFCPPRIFRNNRYGGIDKFFFDNHIQYNNGESFENKKSLLIPRNVAWIKHYSWLETDFRTQEKIKYQNLRFKNGCYFNWDENTNKLSFNQKYFESVNEEQPILHEDIHLVSNDFTISFSRVENLFYIRDVTKSQDVLIRIYNGQNGVLLSSSDLNLYENIDLFYGFEHEKFLDISNFKKFRIEVLNENHLIHHEFLYI